MKSIFCLLLLICFATSAFAQNRDSAYVREHYEKMEVQIPMRDGIKLFTAIYLPKDKSKTYPMLMQRTCYSVDPYGLDKYERSLGPSKYLMRDGYIFVYQDEIHSRIRH